VAAIQDNLTKMSTAWDLWRMLDDQRLRGGIAEADEYMLSRAVIEALKDVAVARASLPTLELEKLVDGFVRSVNKAVRDPRPLEDAEIRREVDSALARFDEAAQPVLRDAKYGNAEKELQGMIGGSSATTSSA